MPKYNDFDLDLQENKLKEVIVYGPGSLNPYCGSFERECVSTTLLEK